MKKSFILFGLILALAMNAQIAVQQNNAGSGGKWTFGGNIGLGPSSDGGFQVSIAPEVGYKASENLELGAAVGYNYFKNDFYKSSFFNFGPYANYSILQSLFLRAQYQYLFGDAEAATGYSFGTSTNKDISESALWLGGGYQSRIGNNVYYRIGMMYNVLYNEDDSVYGSAFLPIGGITIGF